jgi:hypothetical protein
MKSSGLISAMAVILIANTIVYLGIRENRQGEPVQIIELTERELPIQYRDRDDSSIRLRLAYRRSSCQFYPRPNSCDFPFDLGKLQELGFDCSSQKRTDREFRHPLMRVAFVALEYEGFAWRRWLENLPEKSTEIEDSKPAAANASESSAQWDSTGGTVREGTRLFVLDAAQSYDSLRQKYPDPKVLIVRALIRAVLEDGSDSKNTPSGSFLWAGYVEKILPSEIFVPLPFSGDMAKLAPRREGRPRYRVALSFGSRMEPWIESLTLLEP